MPYFDGTGEITLRIHAKEFSKLAITSKACWNIDMSYGLRREDAVHGALFDKFLQKISANTPDYPKI